MGRLRAGEGVSKCVSPQAVALRENASLHTEPGRADAKNGMDKRRHHVYNNIDANYG